MKTNNSIEQNFERIADALETIADILAFRDVEKEKAELSKPFEAKPIKIGFEDARTVLVNFASKHGVEKAKEILADFGAEKISDVRADALEAFVARVGNAIRKINKENKEAGNETREK